MAAARANEITYHDDGSIELGGVTLAADEIEILATTRPPDESCFGTLTLTLPAWPTPARMRATAWFTRQEPSQEMLAKLKVRP